MAQGGYYNEQPFYGGQQGQAPSSDAYQQGYQGHQGQQGYASPNDGYQQAQSSPSQQPAPPGNYNETLITMKEPAYKCNDPFFAVFFLVGLLATIIVGAIYIRDWATEVRVYTSYSLNLDSNLTKATILSSAFGVVFGLLILCCVRGLGGHAVKISLTTMILLCIGGAVVSAFKEWYGSMVFFIIFALVGALYFCCVRKRIPFAEASVLSSVRGIFTYFGVIPIALVGAIVMFGFSIFWVHGINAIIYMLEVDAIREGVEIPTGSIYAAYILYSFAYFWITETIRNVTHTTTAGAIGTWWYIGGNATGVSFGALRRALTSSFGSIALGSLIVATIQTIRLCIRIFIGRRSLLGCCLDCIMGCIERAFRFFNTYAYTYVALYGKTYVQSGGAVSDLFSSSAFTAIINDDLTWTVININSFLAAVVSAVICAFSFAKSDDYGIFYSIMVLAFIFTYFVCCSILTTIASAVNSTFVVWAEDPAAMQAAQPDSFQILADARVKFYN